MIVGTPVEYRATPLHVAALRGLLFAVPFILLTLWRPRFAATCYLLFGCLAIATVACVVLLPVYRRHGLSAVVGLLGMVGGLALGGMWLGGREDARVARAQQEGAALCERLAQIRSETGVYPPRRDVDVPEGVRYIPRSGSKGKRLLSYEMRIEDRFSINFAFWYRHARLNRWIYHGVSTLDAMR